MQANDPDPVHRWQAVSKWYAEFASELHWEFLHPMVDLTVWVSDQPFAAHLYLCTSHQWLCIQLLPGYNPDQPIFTCGVKSDGHFECSLLVKGQRLIRQTVPIDLAHLLFLDFVDKLKAANA